MWLTLYLARTVMNSTVKCCMCILSPVQIGPRMLLPQILTPRFAAPILSQPPAIQDMLKTLFDETIKWMEEIGDQDDGSSSMVASLQHNLQSLTEKYVSVDMEADGQKSQEEALKRQLLAEGEESDRLRQRLDEVSAERDELARKASHCQEMEKEHSAALLQVQSLSEQVALLQAQEAQAQKLEMLNEKWLWSSPSTAGTRLASSP